MFERLNYKNISGTPSSIALHLIQAHFGNQLGIHVLHNTNEPVIIPIQNNVIWIKDKSLTFEAFSVTNNKNDYLGK